MKFRLFRITVLSGKKIIKTYIMHPLKNLVARQVLDSRGNPTIEVDAYSENNMARAIVPSGASVGLYEAVELRDNDESVYMGRGVLKAVKNVNEIIFPEIKGFEIFDQRALDEKLIELDGTENKSKLGANAILGVSMAVAHLAAKEQNLFLFEYLNSDAKLLPVPMMNVINGGEHADSGLDIQEFMIVPVGAQSFSEALRMGTEVFHKLKKILEKNNFSIGVGDEGGFAPRLADNEEALKLILESVEKAGYKIGDEILLSIDSAASEFFDKDSKKYSIKINGEMQKLTGEELTDYYVSLAKRYPLVSIEDSHDEDDWEGWEMMMKKLGQNMQLVGDDIFVTNLDRLTRGIDTNAANSILIKLNQIGTISETIDAITVAKEAGWTAVVSHRSGETEDTTIADFTVGMQTGQIKTGSLSRTDRVCKYNQLLRIEEHLGDKAEYGDKNVLNNSALLCET